jgi:hypothetical protein
MLWVSHAILKISLSARDFKHTLILSDLFLTCVGVGLRHQQRAFLRVEAMQTPNPDALKFVLLEDRSLFPRKMVSRLEQSVGMIQVTVCLCIVHLRCVCSFS